MRPEPNSLCLVFGYPGQICRVCCIHEPEQHEDGRYIQMVTVETRDGLIVIPLGLIGQCWQPITGEPKSEPRFTARGIDEGYDDGT